MIERRFLEVLSQIYTRLNDIDVDWVVTGSLSFALQGVPVTVNDIDIQTDKVGAYKIEDLFSEFVVRKTKFSSAEKIRSHFGVLTIDGIKVEVMGDIQKRNENGEWEQPTDLTKHMQFVEIEDMRIPVLSLKYEYKAYVKLGRTKRAEMLKRWLTK